MVHCMWIECTQLKHEFLFKIFSAFCVPVCKDSLQRANNIVVEMIRKIKMERNWFGCI